ncbi:MAG: zinc-dependent alcohol dehydrogenase family protein [Candidatus Obscuribacterales bacterium]|nr:zinc-dependent alcohol dehydrogenase family protein [Candidatus Obscuribacterales bacterium]
MSKIVCFEKTGDASVLQIKESQAAEPAKGEVRIKVEAFGLNRAEVLFRQGLYLEKPILPARIGYEAAGVVEALGEGVSEFKIGDKVSSIPSFSMSKYGVYGDSAILPATSLSSYPDNLSVEEAASIWMQYMTAYGALVELGKMKAGDYVVITAASSSVGFAALELCKAFGVTSIATTRGQAKKDRLLAAGADHVIVTENEDLVKSINEITNGKGANIFFDAVAGPILMQLAKAAAYGASIFEYGALSLEATPFPLMLSLEKALTVRGYTLFQINKDAEMQKRARNYVYENLKSGKLKPVIDKIFSFNELVESHRYMESNQQNGKIVVRV